MTSVERGRVGAGRGQVNCGEGWGRRGDGTRRWLDKAGVRQSQRWRRLTSLWVGGAVGVGNLGDGRRERAKIGTLTDADTFFFV